MVEAAAGDLAKANPDALVYRANHDVRCRVDLATGALIFEALHVDPPSPGHVSRQPDRFLGLRHPQE